MKLSYHLVNVFIRDGQALSGNPLCVVEDATDLSSAVMQALARQFNLSETTFLQPSDRATARVRIFTPGEELPFAGHPTLGTAHIVRMRTGRRDVSLEMHAGVIPVGSEGNRWTLAANPPTHREPAATRGQIAAALALDVGDIVERPLWVSTGTEQLLVPLRSADAVRAASPVPALLERIRSGQGHSMAYVFHDDGDGNVVSRFFFKVGSGYAEDPATGSACANLGGWNIGMGHAPGRFVIRQGDEIARPSTLSLEIDEHRQIRVAGEVAYLGRGEIEI